MKMISYLQVGWGGVGAAVGLGGGHRQRPRGAGGGEGRRWEAGAQCAHYIRRACHGRAYPFNVVWTPTHTHMKIMTRMAAAMPLLTCAPLTLSTLHETRTAVAEQHM